MRSEADTCQQSSPYLPLAALTMSSTKAAPAEGEFFSFFPKALLRDFFLRVHTPELFNSFQLPNVGTSASSDSESRAIVITELALPLKLGGLVAHNAEQLTESYHVDFWSLFLYVCVCFTEEEEKLEYLSFTS